MQVFRFIFLKFRKLSSIGFATFFISVVLMSLSFSLCVFMCSLFLLRLSKNLYILLTPSFPRTQCYHIFISSIFISVFSFTNFSFDFLNFCFDLCSFYSFTNVFSLMFNPFIFILCLLIYVFKFVNFSFRYIFLCGRNNNN